MVGVERRGKYFVPARVTWCKVTKNVKQNKAL